MAFGIYQSRTGRCRGADCEGDYAKAHKTSAALLTTEERKEALLDAVLMAGTNYQGPPPTKWKPSDYKGTLPDPADQ